MTGEPTEVESAGVPQLSPQGRARSWWAPIRRRRVREEPTVVRAAEAFSEQAAARRPETAGCELLTGGYVTDGRTLFRVEHVHSDARSGETFAELENCTTLELSVWSVDHLSARSVRCVTPVRAPEPGKAACA